MAIRIRVYPQPWSIGARRNRAHRQAQQQLRLERQFLRQQLLDQQRMFGFGGYGSSYGYGFPSPLSPSRMTPPPPQAASSWGFLNAGAYVPGYAPYGAAHAGAWSLPGYGVPTQAGYAGSSSWGAYHGC